MIESTTLYRTNRAILFVLSLSIVMLLSSCNQRGQQFNQGTQEKVSTIEKVKKAGVLRVGYIVYPSNSTKKS